MITFTHSPVNPLRVTSNFGKRNTGIKGASTDHKGIDLGRDFSKAETEICAVADGKVISNYWNDYRGWVVIIAHNGYRTLYQHLKGQSALKVGSQVKSGARIGIMGNSSNKNKLSCAVHLHFELIVSGNRIDPLTYLQNIKKEKAMKDTKVKIGQKQISGKIIDGSTYVPLRELIEAIKSEITVTWDKTNGAGVKL